MSAHLYLVSFIVMAVAINIVVYIGVTMVYVSEKRRGEGSRASGDPVAPSIHQGRERAGAADAAAVQPGDRRYDDRESRGGHGLVISRAKS